MTFMVTHPVTGDWAEAGDLASAERAAQVLRADALDAGTCTSPRVTCVILVGAVDEVNEAAAGRREQGGH